MSGSSGELTHSRQDRTESSAEERHSLGGKESQADTHVAPETHAAHETHAADNMHAASKTHAADIQKDIQDIQDLVSLEVQSLLVC